MKNMKDPRRRVRFAVLKNGHPWLQPHGWPNQTRQKGLLARSLWDYSMSTLSSWRRVANRVHCSRMVPLRVSERTNGLYLTSSAKLYDPKKSGKSGIPRFKVHVKATTPPPLDYACPKGWKFRTDAKKPYGRHHRPCLHQGQATHSGRIQK